MSKSAKTLNDILKNFQDVEIKLIEEEGEISSDVEKMIAQNDLSLADKLDGYEKFARYLKGQIQYLKSAEEDYMSRRKVLENSVKSLKERMLNAMLLTGKDNIKTIEYSFSIGESEKWDVDNEKIDEKGIDVLIEAGLAQYIFKPNIKDILDK